MISFDTLGYFSDEKGSQEYPFPFSHYYPDTADFRHDLTYHTTLDTPEHVDFDRLALVIEGICQVIQGFEDE